MMNGFMYGNVYEDASRFEKHSIFPRLLSRNAEDFSINNTTFNRDALKAGTGRRLKTFFFVFGCPIIYLYSLYNTWWMFTREYTLLYIRSFIFFISNINKFTSNTVYGRIM
jgi:hypothetical protein